MKGMGGMFYTLHCQWNSHLFRAGMADDGYGISCRRIAFQDIGSDQMMKSILAELGKIHEWKQI